MTEIGWTSPVRGDGRFSGGSSPYTRDHSRDKPESEQDMRSPLHKAADFHLALYEQRAKEKQQREQREMDDRRRRDAKRQAAEDLKRRRGQFHLAEQMTEQLFDEAALTDIEKSRVNNALMARDAIHNLEMTRVLTLQVIAERR